MCVVDAAECRRWDRATTHSTMEEARRLLQSAIVEEGFNQQPQDDRLARMYDALLLIGRTGDFVWQSALECNCYCTSTRLQNKASMLLFRAGHAAASDALDRVRIAYAREAVSAAPNVTRLGRTRDALQDLSRKRSEPTKSAPQHHPQQASWRVLFQLEEAGTTLVSLCSQGWTWMLPKWKG